MLMGAANTEAAEELRKKKKENHWNACTGDDKIRNGC